jgi:truncated hemoglobin YjbI
MIRSAVQGFYAEVRRNDLLGALFDAAVAPAAWPGHLAKMCDFWSATLLRTGRYVGRSLPAPVIPASPKYISGVGSPCSRRPSAHARRRWHRS